MIKDEFFTLANSVKIPKVGFGTWQIPDGEVCVNSVSDAIKVGYRHIDTAYAYGNEKSIGKVLKECGLSREEVFITSKCPAEIKTYQGCIDHFNASLSMLGLEYMDLYLIHAPWPWSEVGKDCKEGNIEVWKAMVELYNAGKIRSIGVSNFQPEDIENIVNATGFYPHVNQIRFFIGNPQEHIVKYCSEHNILVEAYSPFATGKILESPMLVEMANKYNTTVSQICLSYCIMRNTLPLPKSTHIDRITANLNCDLKLSSEDMELLNSYKEESLVKPLRS